MRRSKKKGGNCNDLLAAIAPCKYLLSAVIPLKNVDINADVGRLISSRACDELAVNLSNRVNSEVLQDKSISLATDNTEAVDYLYINSRGGYKKMAKGDGSSGIGGNSVCNTCMKGGCFTCNKGKRKLNAYYKEIIIIIPVLYAKYKQFDKKKGKKMKGGYGSFMENIMNVSNLSFEYKPFSPVNFSDQLLDI
jgi:hypothetical protein